uniref:Phospholipase A1 n=1 Tax=Oryza nivara TaxID=4536 RepID=A0A0E0FZF2_ORYNI
MGKAGAVTARGRRKSYSEGEEEKSWTRCASRREGRRSVGRGPAPLPAARSARWAAAASSSSPAARRLRPVRHRWREPILWRRGIGGIGGGEAGVRDQRRTGRESGAAARLLRGVRGARGRAVRLRRRDGILLYARSCVAVPEPFILQSVSRFRRCRESNWIGYVAVATDEGKAALGRRNIFVAWRGTVHSSMAPPKDLLRDKASDAMVHRGWLSMYTSSDSESSHNKDNARDQVMAGVARHGVERGGEGGEHVPGRGAEHQVTGHSLGAALATLNAFDIVANGYNRAPRAAVAALAATGCPVTAFVFANPRVGGHDFKSRFDGARGLGPRLLRVHNTRDVVPRYPTAPLYHGNELVWHNLKWYLRDVAGAWGGEAGRSKLAAYGALSDEHAVHARNRLAAASGAERRSAEAACKRAAASGAERRWASVWRRAEAACERAAVGECVVEGGAKRRRRAAGEGAAAGGAELRRLPPGGGDGRGRQPPSHGILWAPYLRAPRRRPRPPRLLPFHAVELAGLPAPPPCLARSLARWPPP